MPAIKIKLFKNCYHCRHLSYEQGDVGDPEGFVCWKKDLYGTEEDKMLKKMESESYRLKSKRCFEVDMDKEFK